MKNLDIKDIKYGLIAVDPEQEGEMKNIFIMKKIIFIFK